MLYGQLFCFSTHISPASFCFLGIVRHVESLRTSRRQGRVGKSGHASLFLAETSVSGGKYWNLLLCLLHLLNSVYFKGIVALVSACVLSILF